VWKKHVASQCPNCGFEAVSDEDKAKSLILSLEYEMDGEYYGKTKEELEAIAADIRSGKPCEFDPLEVQTIIAYARRVLSITPGALIIDGLRWLLPPIMLLVAALILVSR
jgi:hypothetical protein